MSLHENSMDELNNLENLIKMLSDFPVFLFVT